MEITRLLYVFTKKPQTLFTAFVAWFSLVTAAEFGFENGAGVGLEVFIYKERFQKFLF